MPTWIEPGLSGLTSITPSKQQLNALTSVLCGYLRRLERGKACEKRDADGNPIPAIRRRQDHTQRARRLRLHRAEPFVPATAVTWEYEEQRKQMAAGLSPPPRACPDCGSNSCFCLAAPVPDADDSAEEERWDDLWLPCRPDGFAEDDDLPSCCFRCGEDLTDCKCGLISGGGMQSNTIVISDSESEP